MELHRTRKKSIRPASQGGFKDIFNTPKKAQQPQQQQESPSRFISSPPPTRKPMKMDTPSPTKTRCRFSPLRKLSEDKKPQHRP
jgi:hypothetical protein